jgi:hypothetical protein
MESKSSLLCSQQPATGAYAEPDASSPHFPHPVSLRSKIYVVKMCVNSDFAYPTELFFLIKINV